ncbi:MAG: alanine--tRNA ligase, partial [Candidatus Omnitrophica bacterium]|nr:alanine--tRNA ligase [Candidatus Omnitrophota bacterium]
MQSYELRERFLAFFKRHEHAIVPSDSLIPSGDPTVLFTSAGMNQFKDYFLGKRTDLARAASCQKCLRTGDLDNVGKSPSHHSFFEMLGNFSFGDYFKHEAIRWAWEFLTGTLDFAGTQTSPDREACLNLPGTKLWVSIYEEDEEAFTLWRELGVPAERIRRFGQADNFWPANAPTEGPNGPCGPCSEIYYDSDEKVAGPNSLEVWNLVFTQFDRQPDGSLKPLPKPNIDTGMGLERLARVMQHVETDYETDLFKGIVKRVAGALSMWPITALRDKQSIYTVSDHVRAAVFLIADGVLPSNEERGYVTRMLIRRAHWHGGRLLWNRDERPPFEPFLDEAIPAVVEIMGQTYRELVQKQGFIREAIRTEEKRFSETLQSGNERIQEECARLRDHNEKVLSGDFAFMLKDTFGFPFELLADVVKLYYPECAIDEKRYRALLEEQQERSRAASQFGGAVFTPTTLTLKDVPRSEFVGYDTLQADTVVKGIWKQDGWVQSAREGDEVGVVLERSPFYGESGGQVGDRGTIEAPHGRLDVLETTWADELL